MKTLINQSVVSSSQRFNNNISKLLPSGVKSFSIVHFGMKKASGYGSYNYVMDVEINGEPLTLKKFTHDSMSYDYYTDLEYRSHNFNNWAKRNILFMLETDFINDQIFDIANKDNE